jgi:HEAT repeat protein
MKKLALLGALLVGGSVCFEDISRGHGGTYRGPGDTVPPGGGGVGGGGPSPTGPGPSGPTGGAPTGPNTPSVPGPGSPTGGPAGQPRGPGTPGMSGGPDLSTWDFWWGFNKDQYLNLKSAIYAGGPSTGDFTDFRRTNQPKNSLKPSEDAIRNKIVPALKEALEKERSNDIVTGCLIALGKIGDVKNGDDGSSEFEPLIRKFLADPNQEIAETAAVALGILANDASVPTLKNLALDNEKGRKIVGTTEVKYRTRAFATYGLGLIGNLTPKNEVRQEIARTLIEILQKPDSSTRDVKVAALVSLGLVPINVDASEAGEGKTDHAASRQSQIQFIQKFFLDPEQHYLVRAHAPTALARLLEKDGPADLRENTARMLLDALDPHSKEKEEVQQSCVLALGQIGDAGKDKLNTEIRKTLQRLITEGDQQSRNFTMIALAQVGGRGKGEDTEKGRKDVRDLLLANLTRGKSHIKPWAGLAIGVMERELIDASETPSSTSKEFLREALKDAKAPDLVGAYAIGLGITKDDESKAMMVKKLDETSEPNAKGNLCVALGLMDAREPETVKKLQVIVRDSTYKPELLRQAAIGLGLLGDKDIVPELVTALQKAQALASQAAFASALGFIGDSRSIDPLVEMLKQKDITPSARGFAAVALGIVADKELLPWNSKISKNINYRANTTTLTGEGGTGILDIL